MSTHNKKIIPLSSNNKNSKGKHSLNKKDSDVTSQDPILLINGREIHLNSFVLSGESVDEERVLLTWHSDTDQLIVYAKYLDELVNHRVRETLDHMLES